jgi:hypothetical protein
MTEKKLKVDDVVVKEKQSKGTEQFKHVLVPEENYNSVEKVTVKSTDEQLFGISDRVVISDE